MDSAILLSTSTNKVSAMSFIQEYLPGLLRPANVIDQSHRGEMTKNNQYKNFPDALDAYRAFSIRQGAMYVTAVFTHITARLSGLWKNWQLYVVLSHCMIMRRNKLYYGRWCRQLSRKHVIV